MRVVRYHRQSSSIIIIDNHYRPSSSTIIIDNHRRHSSDASRSISEMKVVEYHRQSSSTIIKWGSLNIIDNHHWQSSSTITIDNHRRQSSDASQPFLCIHVSGTQVSEISMRAKRDVCVYVARECDCRQSSDGSRLINEMRVVKYHRQSSSTITLPCNIDAHVSLCTHRDLRDLCTRDLYAEKRFSWQMKVFFLTNNVLHANISLCMHTGLSCQMTVWVCNYARVRARACVCACVCMWVCTQVSFDKWLIHMCDMIYSYVYVLLHVCDLGDILISSTISRLLKITGLFCRILSLL